MPTSKKRTVPAFKSEKEEAEWWDSHPEVLTKVFESTKRQGMLRRLLVPGSKPRTRTVTIRMPVADLEAAQAIAEQKGLPYQTYIKMVLHEAVRRQRV